MTAGSMAHDLPAEQEVLGALLIDPGLLPEVAAILDASDFARPAHGRIYGAIGALVARGEAASPITLAGYLQGDPEFAAVGGGAAYLAALVDAVSGISTAPGYARIVRDRALRRQAARIGQDLARAPAEDDAEQDARGLIEAADNALVGLLERARGGAATNMAATLDAALDAASAQQAGTSIARLRTGLPALDRLVGGLPRGGFTVFGARPSMGKSALALAIALAAARAGAGVLVYSLEMPTRQVGTRWLASATGVPAARIDRGELSAPDWLKLDAGRRELRDLPVIVQYERGPTPIDIRAGLAAARRRQPVDLVIVDYIQLVRPTRLIRDNPTREMTEISSALADTFGAADVAGLVLSQLSRQVEHRADRRPVMADLRETGALEQDSDVVGLLYRAHYYLSRSPPAHGADQAEWSRWRQAMDGSARDLELSIAKNRQGPTGSVTLDYDVATGQITSPDATPGRAV